MEEKKFSVYMHINKINNKRYIGITSQIPKKRWQSNGNGYRTQLYFYNAIKKYGWDNFEHEILYQELSQNDAESMEIALISKYKSNNSEYGYNISKGGGILVYSCSRAKKKIYQYSMNGEFICKYKSAEEIERLFGFKQANIRLCCSGKTLSAHNYQWTYKYVDKLNFLSNPYERIAQFHAKEVYQYSMDGIFLNKYKSLSEVGRKTGFNFQSISDCCIGAVKQSYGYIWSYDNINNVVPVLDRYIRMANTRSKSVEMYDLDNILIGIFNSAKEIEDTYGIRQKYISRYCHGIRKHDTYIFKYTKTN